MGGVRQKFGPSRQSRTNYPPPERSPRRLRPDHPRPLRRQRQGRWSQMPLRQGLLGLCLERRDCQTHGRRSLREDPLVEVRM